LDYNKRIELYFIAAFLVIAIILTILFEKLQRQTL